MLIDRNDCIFVMIDMQEKFVPVIKDIEKIKKRCEVLIKISEIMDIPLIVTEQYTKGLGPTIISHHGKTIEKQEFSIFLNKKINDTIKKQGKKQIIIFGIETHVCIQQSASEAKDHEIFVVKDATGSRKKEDKKSALRRMDKNNIEIVTSEMVAFELLRTSEAAKFKEISRLIK